MLTLDTENFHRELLKANDLFMAYFWADWCSPCRAMLPVVDALEKECPFLTLGKVNVDDEVEIADRFGIMTIPTLILFEKDRMLKRFVGLHSKDDLLDVLKPFHAKSLQK